MHSPEQVYNSFTIPIFTATKNDINSLGLI